MNRKILFAILIIASVGWACADRNKPSASAVRDGQMVSTQSHQAKKQIPTLPDFTVQEESGKSFSLASLKGRKVFINLWASWCPPCRAEMPSIQKLYHSVDSSKALFVLISLDKSFERAKRFKRFARMQLPIYYPTENLPELFQVQGIPTTFIFNEKGELIQAIDGADNYDTEVYKKMLNG